MLTSEALTKFSIISDTTSVVMQLPTELTSLAGQNVTESLLELGKALLILVVGWLVASIAKGIVKGALRKSDLDNQLSAKILGGKPSEPFPIQNLVGDFTFWIIFLFALVAFFNALELQDVSAPLNSLLQQITTFLPKILGAAILLDLT